MDPQVPGSLFLDIGGWIVVTGLLLFSIMRGFLVPKRTVDWSVHLYDKRMEEKDKQIADLRAAWAAADARGDLLSKNMEQLLEAQKTSNQLLLSLQQALGK